MSLLKDSDGVRRKNWSKLKNLKLTFHDSWCIYIPDVRRQRKLKNMYFSPFPLFILCSILLFVFSKLEFSKKKNDESQVIDRIFWK